MGILKKKTRKISKLPELAEAEIVRPKEVDSSDVPHISPEECAMKELGGGEMLDQAVLVSRVSVEDEEDANPDLPQDVKKQRNSVCLFSEFNQMLSQFPECYLPHIQLSRRMRRGQAGRFFPLIASHTPSQEDWHKIVGEIFRTGVENYSSLEPRERRVFRELIVDLIGTCESEFIRELENGRYRQCCDSLKAVIQEQLSILGLSVSDLRLESF